MCAAGWACTAGVQPVAVGVQAVLDVVRVQFNGVFAADFSGQFPGLALQFEQLEIAVIRVMPQQGMGQLVQQAVF